MTEHLLVKLSGIGEFRCKAEACPWSTTETNLTTADLEFRAFHAEQPTPDAAPEAVPAPAETVELGPEFYLDEAKAHLAAADADPYDPLATNRLLAASANAAIAVAMAVGGLNQYGNTITEQLQWDFDERRAAR